MKRPEREPDFRSSVPVSLASGQDGWRSTWMADRGDPNQRAEAEQEELVSANPLEWWAESDDEEDARFGTGSLISIDASVTGPVVVPDTIRDLPLRPRSDQNTHSPMPHGSRSSSSRTQQWSEEWPQDGFVSPPRPNHAMPPRPARAGATDQSAISPHSREDQVAPLERADTSYVPAWRVSTAHIPAIVERAETMVAVIKRLMRSSGLYAVASLGSPAISLIITPFLAHNMSASDYGLLAVLNTSISLLSGITQLGLGSAFFRAYNYDYTTPTGRRSVLATAMLLLALLSGAFLMVTIPLVPSITGLLVRGDGGAAVRTDVLIALVAVAVQNLSVPGFAWLRAENRALAFSIVSLANVLTTLAVAIVLVGYLHAGVAGALIASGSGYAAVVIVTIIPLLARSHLRVSLKVARSMTSFGAPMVLNVASVWILQLSDRYLLSFFGDLKQTASYSVAYTLGSVLSTIVLAPFSLAWPTAMYSIAKRKDAGRVYQQVFRWFTAVLLLAAFGLSLVSTVLLDELFPPSYHDAAPVIPIVAASIAMYGAYTVLMVGANIRRKTWMSSVFTMIAALVNVGLNLILIPIYGAIGAAASTFFAYLALVVIAYIANQRIYPVPFEVTRALFAGLMGIALYYVVAALPDVLHQRLGTLGPSLGPAMSESIVALAVAVVGLLVYGVWLYMLLQIRTIDFRVNPAIMRRLTRRASPRDTGRGLSEEVYVGR